jgi:hypothetical protein
MKKEGLEENNFFAGPKKASTIKYLLCLGRWEKEK